MGNNVRAAQRTTKRRENRESESSNIENETETDTQRAQYNIQYWMRSIHIDIGTKIN